MRGVSVLLAIYVTGVVIGLWRVTGSLPTRIALALLWPAGPLAGVIVVAGLLLVALVAFPRVGTVVVAGAVSLWWITR